MCALWTGVRVYRGKQNKVMPHKVMARDISTGFVRRFTLWEKSGTVKNESYAVEILNF